MYASHNLTVCADAISFFANAREQMRAASSVWVMEKAHSTEFGDTSELLNMEMALSHVAYLIGESLKVSIGRPSELAARLRILNEGARTLGVDHPVVGQAAEILARDIARISSAP